jgi:hypothetical protein
MQSHYTTATMGALVWNRTSISCASGRRHHQIGYEGIVVAGWCPATGIVDYSVVRERVRCATHPRGSGESNPVRSVKSRVLRRQSFCPGCMIDLQKRKKPPWFPRAASDRTIDEFDA